MYWDDYVAERSLYRMNIEGPQSAGQEELNIGHHTVVTFASRAGPNSEELCELRLPLFSVQLHFIVYAVHLRRDSRQVLAVSGLSHPQPY